MSAHRITLKDITADNITDLMIINSYVFPNKFQADYYEEVLSTGKLSKLAYLHNKPVGAVCCSTDKSQGVYSLYLITIGVLSTFRRRGVGTVLLQHVVNQAMNDNRIKSIFAHVQVSNHDALNFYKNFGFEIATKINNYYKNMEQSDAYVIQKMLNMEDDDNNADDADDDDDINDNDNDNNDNGNNNKNKNNPKIDDGTGDTDKNVNPVLEQATKMLKN